MLKEYVDKLGYSEAASYCGWLRQFQRFVRQHSPHHGLTERVAHGFARKQKNLREASSSVRHSSLKDSSIGWYRGESCRAILWMICKLRPMPRYGSHLGSIMHEHIQRMRTLGCRYGHENVFLRFDRFLQQRPDADHESVGTLIHEYVADARSVNARLRRLILGRIIARALNRQGTSVAVPPMDPLLLRQNRNQQLQP